MRGLSAKVKWRNLQPICTVNSKGSRTNERTNERSLFANERSEQWLPIEAEAHQSWPPKKN